MTTQAKGFSKRLLGCAAVALIAGCLSAGERTHQRYYVLEDAGPVMARANATRAGTLLVAPTTVAAFYDTQDMAYSRATGTRAYYQYHAWTERPGRTIGGLLTARLERGGAFQAVARTTGGVRGGLLLNTHLVEFYHDAATAPGSARIMLTAELVDPARRVLVARRTFTREAPAATYDAAGAVQAFNQALGAMLDEVSAWVDASAPR
jgi:cholesterol transport system auxiliary component